jgi:hypothetical protein
MHLLFKYDVILASLVLAIITNSAAGNVWGTWAAGMVVSCWLGVGCIVQVAVNEERGKKGRN